jgi:plastocyanin
VTFTRNRRSTLVLVALGLALVVLAAVALSPSLRGGSTLGGIPAGADAATKPVKITIKNYAYSRPTITIKVGRKVTWTNQDSMEHNAYSDKKGGPKGPLLSKGKSYSWTPKKAGTYKYYCQPHKFMKSMNAVIIVKN